MIPYYEKAGIVIYHGDCRDILPTLPQVDHVISDPPYSRDLYLKFRTNKGNGTRGHDGEESQAHRELANLEIGAIEDSLPIVGPELLRLTQRWMLVFHDAEYGQFLWREVFGENYVRTGVWIKTNAVPQISGDRPAQGYESCTIAHGPTRKRWNGGGLPAVWRYASAGGNDRPDHPCPKPLPLMRRLVELFTDTDETILDPFAGSGTTGVAAYQLHRKAILIEMEEKWCEVTAKRLEAETPPLPLYVAEKHESPVLL